MAINRIKGIKIKGHNGYSEALTPFGTDGKLIDMASSLDLQEELILGGSCITSIKEKVQLGTDLTGTVVLQKYYTKEGNTTRYTYSLRTVISDTVDDLILVGYDENEQELLITENSGNNDFLVDRKQMGQDQAFIEETLYLGQYKENLQEGESQATVIHSKRIVVQKQKLPGEETSSQIIDEQIDQP